MNSMPTLFVSHGAPTYALEPGLAGAALAALGRALPPPAAVLVVSAHWVTPAPRVTLAANPGTVHDFHGFPAELYGIDYPASGEPALARRTVAVLRDAGWDAAGDAQRGLDHGAWVPLRHMYPDADVPVIQVSLPSAATAETAFAFGKALRPLAAEGLLVVGSGSLTHNLAEVFGGATDTGYVAEFSAWIRAAVVAGDVERLVHALRRAPHAARAHPTAEHYLPLLVAAGAAAAIMPATVLDGGVDHGVLAMDSFLFGTTLLGQAETESRMGSQTGQPR